MIRTTDLRFFSKQEVVGFRTSFRLDVQSLRALSDTEALALSHDGGQEVVVVSPNGRNQDRLRDLIAEFRSDTYQNVKSITLILSHSAFGLCKPLDDIQLFVALLHQQQAHREKQATLLRQASA